MRTPSGYLTVCHGKSPFLIGKPSINGQFPMAMLNNQRDYFGKKTAYESKHVGSGWYPKVAVTFGCLFPQIW
jgi:hypothetical protein